jgi:linoleoyl-CoA desaturase
MHDKLWFIGGRAYDLAPFCAQHPGGHAAITLGRGTNCTELFKSYHLSRLPAATLKRYEVSVNPHDPDMARLLQGAPFTFEENGFYQTVQKRVRAHLLKTQKGGAMGASRFVRVASLLGIAVVIALTYPAFVRGSLVAAVLLGVIKALVSVGPGHSMSHFSLFPRGDWNSLVFRAASPFMVSTWTIWSASHVRSHHVHTLTADDLQDNYPLKRVQPAFAHRWWHRAQHGYMWLVYLLGIPLWTLQDFVLGVISLGTGRHMGAAFTLRERIENVLILGFNIVFSMALPFFFLPWAHALAVSLIVNVISSLMIVTQIVVNHEVPDTMGASPLDSPVDWGVHQVLTSHNFGVDSALALHLSGGLNMQVEHHLFPGLHYTHFPAVSAIVRSACAEFGLPYHASLSIFEAVGRHYQVLKLNSQP